MGSFPTRKTAPAAPVAGCPVSAAGYDAPPDVLGPDSLTWKVFGDWRGLLQGPWAGSMQNMHPQLGAAVQDHSIFFMERIPTAERFGGGLTEDQKRQLFDEHVIWYRQYGMSMRPVPKTWEEFQQYWDHMCRNVLENYWAAREVLDLSTMPKHPSLQWIPDWLWQLQLKVLGPFAVWVTVGLYDPPVRELMGYTWSARDERLHRLFGQAVHVAFRLLPERRRMHPRARAGWDRASGRIPADTPLVHTPAGNLPPVEHRDKPIHYCPKV